MKFELRHLLTALVFFAISVATCYLFGYWGAFKINPLELISFADVAKAAIYPLIGSFAFVAVGLVWSELAPFRSILPYGGANSGDRVSFAKKHARKFYGLLLLVVVLTYYFFPEPYKWTAIGMGVGLLMLPLSSNEFLIKIIPNDVIRSNVVMFPAFILGIAFFSGRADALQVKQGDPSRVLDVARSKLPFVSSSEKPVGYLGILGETHFFYESASGEVASMRDRDDLTLFFKPEMTLSEKLDAARKRSQIQRKPAPLNTIPTKSPIER